MRGKGSAAAEKRTTFLSDFLNERRSKYCTGELVLATLLDPINAVKGSNGAYMPPTGMFSKQQLDAAKAALKRLAPAIAGIGRDDFNEADKKGAAARADSEYTHLLTTGFHEMLVYRSQWPRTDGKDPQWFGINRRRDAWKHFVQQDSLHDDTYPSLAPVAMRLLSQHATSAAVERSWSQWGNLFTANRNRMLANTGQNLMFIRNAWQVEQRCPPPTPEKEFWEELDGTPEGTMLMNDTEGKLYEHEVECVDNAVNPEDLDC
jgi:hAT family C-terminal dimerisation region